MIFKKRKFDDSYVELSFQSTINSEFCEKYCHDYIYIYVFFPESIVKEINENNEKLYCNIKKIDNEIDEKIFKVELIGYIYTKYTNFISKDSKDKSYEKININIFISKDSKNKLVNSIKSKLPSNTNIAENFFSKLFDKDNYISSIINYCQNYYENTFICYEEEAIKYFFNGKEIKENLKINEIGLKDNSKILVLDALKKYNLFFKDKYKYYSVITIICNQYEIFSSVIEKFRIKTNIISKNIKFTYQLKTIDWSLTLYELFCSDLNPNIYFEC